MASKTDKLVWLREHLTYELWMLNWSYVYALSNEGMPYNVAYECFAVHARLLELFLTNGETQNNYQARDFIKGFKLKIDKPLSGLFVRLNAQVFHPGMHRTSEPDGKVKRSDLPPIYSALSDGMNDFVAGLEDEFRDAWNVSWSRMVQPQVLQRVLPQSSDVTSTSTITSFVPSSSDGTE